MTDGMMTFKCIYAEDLLNGSIEVTKDKTYVSACVVCLEDVDKTALFMRLKNGEMVKLRYCE